MLITRNKILTTALAAGVAAISVALPLWQAHDPVTEATIAAAPVPAAEPAAPQGPAAVEAPAAPAAAVPAAPSPEPAPKPAPARAPQAKQLNGRQEALPVTRPAKPAARAVEKKTVLEDAVVAEDVTNAPPPGSESRRYSRSAPAATGLSMPAGAAKVRMIGKNEAVANKG
eukprot:gene29709-33543_t